MAKLRSLAHPPAEAQVDSLANGYARGAMAVFLVIPDFLSLVEIVPSTQHCHLPPVDLCYTPMAQKRERKPSSVDMVAP